EANSYTWRANANNSNISTISISPPLGTYTYVLTGQNAPGCSGSASFVIHVSPSPTLAISGTSAVCSGSSVTLNASGASSYQWNTGATTSALTATVIIPTTFTVTGTSNGCANTATYGVGISPGPTLSVVAPSNSVC